jgi:hypothetical protein
MWQNELLILIYKNMRNALNIFRSLIAMPLLLVLLMLGILIPLTLGPVNQVREKEFVIDTLEELNVYEEIENYLSSPELLQSDLLSSEGDEEQGNAEDQEFTIESIESILEAVNISQLSKEYAEEIIDEFYMWISGEQEDFSVTIDLSGIFIDVLKDSPELLIPEQLGTFDKTCSEDDLFSFIEEFNEDTEGELGCKIDYDILDTETLVTSVLEDMTGESNDFIYEISLEELSIDDEMASDLRFSYRVSKYASLVMFGVLLIVWLLTSLLIPVFKLGVILSNTFLSLGALFILLMSLAFSSNPITNIAKLDTTTATELLMLEKGNEFIEILFSGMQSYALLLLIIPTLITITILVVVKIRQPKKEVIEDNEKEIKGDEEVDSIEMLNTDKTQNE